MEISKNCVMVMTSVSLLDRSSCKTLEVLEKRVEVKQTGSIGFGANDKKELKIIGFGANDKKELKILNRTIKINVLNGEMTLETDTKLVENALEIRKLKGAKSVDSSRVRRNEKQKAQIENSEKLTSVESTLYRSLVMKLAYVAQDRVDIAEAVKFLTRHMKEPWSGHMQELKRLGRYPVKNRRCVLTCARQTSDGTLQVRVDSDRTGVWKEGTTDVIVRRDEQLLRLMSCLQTLFAL